MTIGALSIVSGAAPTIWHGELLFAACVLPPLVMLTVWRHRAPVAVASKPSRTLTCPVWSLKVMNVRPLHDRIIVHRLDEGEQQIGGIIIPDSAKEKPQRGTVFAVGGGKR